MIRILSNLTLGGLMVLTPAAAFDNPRWSKLEQNTRTVQWQSVTRVTVAQGSARSVRITGPWMDYISSVNASGGVSGRNIAHVGWQQSTIILDGSPSATRGNKTISVNIACPFGGELLGCTKGPVSIPVKVLATGPLAHVYPNGTVPPNTAITFDITGSQLDAAMFLNRLLTLKNATILSQSATAMRVRGTTPACGGVDIALSDKEDGDETPYRRGSTYEKVLAGAWCPGTFANTPQITYTLCAPGQTYNYTTNTCNDDE